MRGYDLIWSEIDTYENKDKYKDKDKDRDKDKTLPVGWLVLIGSRRQAGVDYQAEEGD